MKKRYDHYKSMIEAALAAYFDPKGDHSVNGLLEAMDYSLMAGGKRIRPVLTLAFCRAAGGDPETALPVACGVEMLHTYSLIHDDLPCMDNDDLRRGRPTNHKVYGECTATLAGDALQAEAFGAILRSGLPAERRARCAEALADAAGVDGICGGQYLDMLGENKALTQNELTEIHSRKTGSMLVAACRMGVLTAGGSPEQEEAAMRYGAALGVAFQIRDDMLDEIATEAELGKPIGSDRAEGKTTFMTLYGKERCQEMVQCLTNEAKAVAGIFAQPEFLLSLADQLAERTN